MAPRTSASSGTASPGRTHSSAKNAIVKLLKEDHKKAKAAFKAFEKMDPHEDPEGCQALVEQTCAELEVHAELEEQLFYPAARKAIKEEDLIEEAEVEHMTFKVLLEQLKKLEVEDEKYAATFKVLGEYVQHHVKEEEGEMFKQLANDEADWPTVRDQMLARRGELLEEKGLPAEEATASTARASARSAAASSTRAGSPSSHREARPQAADDAEDE